VSRIPEHVIAEISYRKNRLVCACGARMKAAGGVDWLEHRNRYILPTPKERKRGKPLTIVGRREAA